MVWRKLNYGRDAKPFITQDYVWKYASVSETTENSIVENFRQYQIWKRKIMREEIGNEKKVMKEIKNSRKKE